MGQKGGASTMCDVHRLTTTTPISGQTPEVHTLGEYSGNGVTATAKQYQHNV
jgi:hypothetical protein